jgi:hypothetical protein
MTNHDMFASIEEDSLDQVAGGTFCFDPCKVVGDVIAFKKELIGAGLEKVGGVLDCLGSIKLDVDFCSKG